MLMFSRVQAQTKLVLEKGKVQKWASMSRMWCWEHFVGSFSFLKPFSNAAGQDDDLHVKHVKRLQFQPGHFGLHSKESLETCEAFSKGGFFIVKKMEII